MKLQPTKHQQTLQTIDNNSHLATNLYELALLLAEAKSRHSQDRWGCFIDHLSQICDVFATSRQQTDTQIPETCSETEIVSQLSTDSDFARHQMSIHENHHFSIRCADTLG